MPPDGRCIGRAVIDGVAFVPIDLISVVGDDILIWQDSPITSARASSQRNQQVAWESQRSRACGSYQPQSSVAPEQEASWSNNSRVSESVALS